MECASENLSLALRRHLDNTSIRLLKSFFTLIFTQHMFACGFKREGASEILKLMKVLVC